MRGWGERLLSAGGVKELTESFGFKDDARRSNDNPNIKLPAEQSIVLAAALHVPHHGLGSLCLYYMAFCSTHAMRVGHRGSSLKDFIKDVGVFMYCYVTVYLSTNVYCKDCKQLAVILILEGRQSTRIYIGVWQFILAGCRPTAIFPGGDHCNGSSPVSKIKEQSSHKS